METLKKSINFCFTTEEGRRRLAKLLIGLFALLGVKKGLIALFDWLKANKLLSSARRIQREKIRSALAEIRSILKSYERVYPDSATEARILRQDVQGLVKMLDGKEATSVQLLLVYLHRCVEVGAQMNAITDFNHLEALAMAEECDQLRFTLEVLPPLYGIPVSVKNNYAMKGLDTSLAMVQRFGKVEIEDGLLVRMIKKELGAIPFVKTNVPVGIFGTETGNHIYGLTLSAYGADRSPGGSSGGEACLVSTGCSPIGFGTDAAGSLRTPALFCGLYSFMVTPGRVTTKGIVNAGFKNQEFLKPGMGPIGRSVGDLQLVVRALIDSELMQDLDFYVESRPWNTSLNPTRKFKIAVFPQSQYFDLTVPQKRVMGMVINKLEEKGHIITIFDYKDSYKIVEHFIRMASSLISTVSGEFKYDFLEGESKLVRAMTKVPSVIRCIGEWVLSFGGSERTRELIRVGKKISVSEFLILYEEIQVMIDEIHKKFENENIDALIVPGLSVAYRHGTAAMLTPTHSAHIFANAARMCSGTVPIDIMRSEEGKYEDRFNDWLTQCIKSNLAGGEGLPIGVQVCGGRYRDEQCLEVMKEIESLFNYHVVKV